MQQQLLNTTNSYNWLLVRTVLGTVMLGHGLQKAFGWFHGYGWEGTMGYFTGSVGMPAWLGAFVILIESLGALLLIIGFAGRINAALIGLVMVGAFFAEHVSHGFFMNWDNDHAGEGYEFDILMWTLSVLVVINGSGRFSVDRWLITRRQNTANASRSSRALAQ